MSDVRIEPWYGNEQTFGTRGAPQRWINILGRVSPAERLRSLTYSLNGEPERALATGPDKRRLAGVGDFNIELECSRLRSGDNVVDITATARDGKRTSRQVTVGWRLERSYHPSPLPHSVEWNEDEDLPEAAQVVDGLWLRTDDGIRTMEPGYDRLIAIGDQAWTDYEISVPITVHGVDPTGFRYPSNGPGVGLMTRWRGQYQWRREPGFSGSWPLRTLRRLTGRDDWSELPRWGWWPLGALGWYRWNRRGAELSMIGNAGAAIANAPCAEPPRTGETYMFKMRCQSVIGGTGFYGLKVWIAGDDEPEAWSLRARGAEGELAHGSAVLVAHHVDATFGDVVVEPLTPRAEAIESAAVPATPVPSTKPESNIAVTA